MIRLTDEELGEIFIKEEWSCLEECDVRVIANAATKKALLGIGKEATRLDGTVYLVPDYTKYRQAIKEIE